MVKSALEWICMDELVVCLRWLEQWIERFIQHIMVLLWSRFHIHRCEHLTTFDSILVCRPKSNFYQNDGGRIIVSVSTLVAIAKQIRALQNAKKWPGMLSADFLASGKRHPFTAISRRISCGCGSGLISVTRIPLPIRRPSFDSADVTVPCRASRRFGGGLRGRPNKLFASAGSDSHYTGAVMSDQEVQRARSLCGAQTMSSRDGLATFCPHTTVHVYDETSPDTAVDQTLSSSGTTASIYTETTESLTERQTGPE